MFFILTVIYNKNLQTSQTLKGLLNSFELLNKCNSAILIWDNSVNPLANIDISKLTTTFTKVNYIHCPQNEYLSKVYNKAIDTFLIGNNKYLVLLDDDTIVTQSFFQEALDVVTQNNEIDLLLPKIYHKKQLVSPSNYYHGHGVYLKNISSGVVSAKNKMAINSGMIISKHFLASTNFKYAFTLRNYGTDNYFMLHYSLQRKNLYVLNTSINHSLSMYEETTSVQKKIDTYKEISRALKIVHPYSLLVRIILLKNKISLAVKYKAFSFLK